MKRYWIVIIVALILSLTSLNGFVECKTMNNLQFAKEILRIIDVKVPDVTIFLYRGKSQDEELFEVYSNILLEKGIDIFTDKQYSELVKNRDLYRLFSILKENNLLVKVKLCLRKDIGNPFYNSIGKCEEVYELNIDEFLQSLPNNGDLLCADVVINSLKQKITVSPLNPIPEHIIQKENRASKI